MILATRSLHGRRISRSLGFLASSLILLAAACASNANNPIISSEQKSGGPDYSGIIITTDMAVGKSRILFGVVDRDGMPVPGLTSKIDAYFLVPGKDQRELKDSKTAAFTRWPTTESGVFSAELELNTPGFYEIDINYTSNDNEPIFAQASFALKAETSTPGLGSRAPASVTHKASDAEDISHITSSTDPDLDLYELSIHEALEQDKPLVVVFATPAFCASATCGPQVGELTKVKQRIGNRSNYIHVEVFEDPHLVDGQRPRGGLIAAVSEWGLPTEPWTFIIDSQGIIRGKFEQFTTADEIEARLLDIL